MRSFSVVPFGNPVTKIRELSMLFSSGGIKEIQKPCRFFEKVSECKFILQDLGLKRGVSAYVKLAPDWSISPIVHRPLVNPCDTWAGSTFPFSEKCRHCLNEFREIIVLKKLALCFLCLVSLEEYTLFVLCLALYRLQCPAHEIQPPVSVSVCNR